MAANQGLARRQLSAAERAQRDAAFRVDVRGFGDVLNVLVRTFNAISSLNTALSSGKGNALAFPYTAEDGSQSVVLFNRRHLRSANAEFGQRIRQLKSYFRVSMRRQKKQVPPESFSGVFAPVYAGQALREFFVRGGVGFGSASPSLAGGQNLMDLLPNAKQGWLLRNTTTLLFFAYAHAQRLQNEDDGRYARSDAVMDAVFNGSIPAAAYPNIVGQEVGKDNQLKNKINAVPMSVAVAQGATQPLNTYQALQQAYPAFNPASFQTYFFQNMAAYNYYTRNMLAVPGVIVDPVYSAAGISESASGPSTQEVASTLASIQEGNPGEMGTAMLREHAIAMEASNGWRAINEPKQRQNRAERKREKDAAGRGAARQRQARGAGIVQLPPLNR